MPRYILLQEEAPSSHPSGLCWGPSSYQSQDTSIQVNAPSMQQVQAPLCLKLGLSSTQFKENQLVKALRVP